MNERFRKSIYAIAILFGFSSGLQGQQPGDVLTVDQAVNEAITHNLDFFAQKYDLSIAEAQIVTAKLRPNPLLTLDADHLDLLGTGFSLSAPPGKMPNNGGPQEYAGRIDYLYERGGKRQARTLLAVGSRDVTRLGLADSVRGLIQSVQSAYVDVVSAKDTLKLAQENRRYDDALTHLQQVMRMFPSFAIDHQRLAHLYAYRGEFDKAIAEETQARILAGEDPRSVVELENSLHKAFAARDRGAIGKRYLNSLDEGITLRKPTRPPTAWLSSTFESERKKKRWRRLRRLTKSGSFI
ncbi:TolC family protein [Edaphobacter aggregans]|uniref:TolC family protein n=1 Tax=Edaphobacter aggregans TaxID=570835 RepID=UPI000554146F|nr:TolC family protein [Edaphobacter aggregans]